MFKTIALVMFLVMLSGCSTPSIQRVPCILPQDQVIEKPIDKLPDRILTQQESLQLWAFDRSERFRLHYKYNDLVMFVEKNCQ